MTSGLLFLDLRLGHGLAGALGRGHGVHVLALNVDHGSGLYWIRGRSGTRRG